MNYILVLGLLLAGLVLLVVGAEILVRGASNLAASLGISPLTTDKPNKDPNGNG